VATVIIRFFKLLIVAELFGVVGVYLFVTAPPPLDPPAKTTKRIPIDVAFEILNHENARTRALYAEEIVGAGKHVGLHFREDWRRTRDNAGPLPALFLRETAEVLAANNAPIALFLGSDRPINRANMLNGDQAKMFEEVRKTRSAVFSYTLDTRMFTAMFPDVAVSAACIDCHNKHDRTPKRDWRLGDVMGAVTWTHHAESVTADELAMLVEMLRSAIGTAYGRYLQKVAAGTRPPVVGAAWPKSGYFLPSRDVFLSEVGARTSSVTLTRLLGALQEAR
jgi:adenylate cyclase